MFHGGTDPCSPYLELQAGVTGPGRQLVLNCGVKHVSQEEQCLGKV